MPINIGNKKVKISIGNKKVSKVYLGNIKIYSSGSICTYICDGNTYQEEVDEGASCLSPRTFTPAKPGWEFVGWRQDTAANGSVLSCFFMGDAPVTLYAVFRQTITLSYNGNSATSGSTAAQTGTRYYNSGNYQNPTFVLSANGFSHSGYTFTKWALGSAGGTQYAAGSSITLAENIIMYAVWTKPELDITGNPNYISHTAQNGNTMGCGIWYSVGAKSETHHVYINYGEYNKATIKFKWKKNNIGKGDDGAYIRVNGVELYRTSSYTLEDGPVHTESFGASTYVGSDGPVVSYYEYTCTYSGITDIKIEMQAVNPVDAGSWAQLDIWVESAKLSM